jgi:WD40 repeat protein
MSNSDMILHNQVVDKTLVEAALSSPTNNPPNPSTVNRAIEVMKTQQPDEAAGRVTSVSIGSNHQQRRRRPGEFTTSIVVAISSDIINDTTTTAKNQVIVDNNKMMVEPSSSAPPPTVALEIIIRILKFIPDRTDWNSVASCNKMIYKISKDITDLIPPWPHNFRLSIPRYGPDQRYYRLYNHAWSPDGTQIACSFADKIIIFDQRRCLLRFRRHGDNNGDNKNNSYKEIGWIAHVHFKGQKDSYLIYSPDGSFLVSAGSIDGLVKIWNYNSTDGYYQKVQEWNLLTNWLEKDDIDVSPCGRYVVVLANTQVLLKDDQNNGKTIRSMVLAEHELGFKVMFSKKDGNDSIFILFYPDQTEEVSIKIWRPYDDIDEEDDPDTTASLITVLEPQFIWGTFALSHDNSIIVRAEEQNITKVMLYSIDNDTKSATLKQSFPANFRYGEIFFTPGDKYILYKNKNGLAFWNITTGREITDQIKTTYNNQNSQQSDDVISFSPAGASRRFLVEDNTDKGFYIASYWESKN